MVGFFLLFGITVLLMLHVQAHAVQHALWYAAPLLIVFMAMLCSVAREWIVLAKGRIAQVRPSIAPVLVAVVVGSLVTAILAKVSGVGPVVASAHVGAVAALVSPTWAAAVFCGSFVGMLSPESFPALYQLVIATLACAFLFWLGSPVFAGYGGKLGTTAFFGCIGLCVNRPEDINRKGFKNEDVEVCGEGV